jgi:putative ABC transport system permease protein
MVILWSQIPLKYNFRSVLVRRTGTLMAVLSVAATVGVFVSTMALWTGLEAAFTDTGDPLNVLVIRKNSQVEGQSSVEREKLQTLQYLEGIAKDSQGRPLVSAEIQILMLLPRAGGEKTNVILRGISPNGLLLRPQVRLVEGRMFRTGLREVIVSRLLAQRFAMQVGQPLRLEGTSAWQITGLFDGNGSAYDSEMWTDVNNVAGDFQRTTYSSVLLRAADSGAIPRLVRRITDDQQLQLEARSETEYFREQTKSSIPIKILGSFIALIMSVGACFAAMNAMFAQVAYRAREIGTLRVLGFKRRAVLAAFLIESIFLAILGGAAGCLLALPVHGISTGTMSFTTFSELAFHFRIQPLMLAAGVGFAALMGALGGFLPAVLAARRPIVQSLRA